jgi:glycosyltransferase involved in cell wall biosynthesis
MALTGSLMVVGSRDESRMTLGNRRVFLVDLLALSPFYDRYLLEALTAQHPATRFYTTSFPYEVGFWDAYGVPRAPGVSDRVAQLGIADPRLRRGLQAVEYAANWAKLIADTRRERPAVVHLQWLPMLEVSGVELAGVKQLSRAGAAVVYTVHNALPHDGAPALASRYRRAYAAMDRLLVHTEHERARLVSELEVPSDKIDIVPHGPMFHDLPRESRADARRALGLAEEDEVALCLGIVRPYKGLEDLVTAMLGLARRRPRLKLLIAGQGDRKFIDRLIADVRASGQDSRVMFLDRYIPVAEVPALYAAADVTVLPYRAASQSGALFAAAALNAPLVATAVGGIGELLQGRDFAALAPPNNPALLARAIDEALDLPASERHARARRFSAWISRESDWARAAQDTLAAYERAVVAPAARC